MGKKNGRQKGPQRHAEGAHGEKTHRRFIEQLHEGTSREPEEAGEGKHVNQDPQHRTPGKHRLFENRQQHAEPEKNSEKTRLSRDIDRHDHNRENFQVVGGAESSRAMPRSRTNPTNPDAPSRGKAPAPEPEELASGAGTQRPDRTRK